MLVFCLTFGVLLALLVCVPCAFALEMSERLGGWIRPIKAIPMAVIAILKKSDSRLIFIFTDQLSNIVGKRLAIYVVLQQLSLNEKQKQSA
jgi:hypothetical protein